jgi:hypothetical protein
MSAGKLVVANAAIQLVLASPMHGLLPLTTYHSSAWLFLPLASKVVAPTAPTATDLVLRDGATYLNWRCLHFMAVRT